jgi:hypothetical protein
MLITTGSLVAFSNDGIGFLTGMVAAVLLAVQRLGPRVWYERFIEGVKFLDVRKRQSENHILISSTDGLSEGTNSNHSLVDFPRGTQ